MAAHPSDPGPTGARPSGQGGCKHGDDSAGVGPGMEPSESRDSRITVGKGTTSLNPFGMLTLWGAALLLSSIDELALSRSGDGSLT